MKQFSALSFLLFMALQTAYAQVPKKTIVEHFTNTKCSVCAARNPGFYANLNNQQNVLHLAIHPSAPYSGCLLYQQNASENDARTNHYGIYGSTPRLVINGDAIPNATNYSDASLFSPYQSLTSPISIRISQYKYGSDSIRAKVVVKTVANHTLTTASLFTALAEDTVFYTGSNGEPQHFGVFRKSLSNVTGNSITIPANVGDSLVFSFGSALNGIWDSKRMYVIAVLQESGNKKLVQAEASEAKTNMATTGLSENGLASCYNIYPNPANYRFTIESASILGTIKMIDAMGKEVFAEEINANVKILDVSSRPSGIYFIQFIKDNKIVSTRKIVVMR